MVSTAVPVILLAHLWDKLVVRSVSFRRAQHYILTRVAVMMADTHRSSMVVATHKRDRTLICRQQTLLPILIRQNR